jgi:hypothetical protein
MRHVPTSAKTMEVDVMQCSMRPRWALMGIAFALPVFVACNELSPKQPTAVIAGGSKAVQRPVEEFVAAQGTFCIDDGMGGCFLFVPPLDNFLGTSDPARGIIAALDYAGVADEWITSASSGSITFGTTFSGSVTENPLADGRAEVHVVLHTKNALVWGAAGDGSDFAGAPLLFGHRATDVLAGEDAALGDITMQAKFINTAPGAAMPDLLQLFFDPQPGQEVVWLMFRGSAVGTLRAEFGVPDGTPGSLTDIQNGLFMTGFMGAVGDGFPVERINIVPIGAGGHGQLAP